MTIAPPHGPYAVTKQPRPAARSSASRRQGADPVRVMYVISDLSIGGAEMPMEPHNVGFEPSTIPQFNIYHPDHPTQRAAEQQITSERSCSWLYGVFVLNPNGKVSPCCAVPSTPAPT